MSRRDRLVLVFVLLSLTACTTVTTGARNEAGRPSVYNDPGTVGPVAGVGIESQDVISMTDQMMRDMLARLPLTGGRVPQVIVDAEYFRNEGSSRINRNLITDRLRVELNRAAANRIRFVARHLEAMVAEDGGRPLPPDYRLAGRIATIDGVDGRSGLTSRHHQITFEMVSLADGTVIWSGIYEFRKSAADDVVYR